MSLTPMRREYAKARIVKLEAKVMALYHAKKTPGVREAIKSSQTAIKRWRRILAS